MNYEKEISKLADYSNPYGKREDAYEELSETNKDSGAKSFAGGALGGVGGALAAAAVGLPLGRLAGKLGSNKIEQLIEKAAAKKGTSLDKIIETTAKDIADGYIPKPTGKASNLTEYLREFEKRQNYNMFDMLSSREKLQKGVVDTAGVISAIGLGGLGAMYGADKLGTIWGESIPGGAQAEQTLLQLLNETDPKTRTKLADQLRSHFSQLEEQKGSGFLGGATGVLAGLPIAALVSHPGIARATEKMFEKSPWLTRNVAETPFGQMHVGETGADLLVASPVAGAATTGIYNLTADPEKYQNPF